MFTAKLYPFQENHEENYKYTFNWEIDENNTSKFLIVLLFYLLNFFVQIQKILSK